ncbi:MAG: hypothetical protein WCY97_04525 [Methanothrix sp.]|jgi:hypothetical protein|nr:hypothetical protein [Methanothrix harundinacea]MDD2637534.1 hypothetical protein [Methanothrix sp.]MDD3709138.1 hypothetical protein [Methanothrix sp.]MDD5767080.1 hypothetical protein [Methanothrix sp.]MDI9398290.1 hypothetical protein [Euryarchaeota archaeon]
MRRILPVLLLVLMAGQAEASVFFKIVEVPTVYVSPEGEASFTIFVENLGSKSTYAGLKFRNIPEGLSIVGPRCTKWVDSGTTLEFDCQLSVEAGDISPGSYSFEVGIVATGAPPEWTEVEVIVSDDVAPRIEEAEGADSAEPEEYPPCPVVRDVGGTDEESVPGEGEEETPGFGGGAALGALALIFISERIRRR